MLADFDERLAFADVNGVPHEIAQGWADLQCHRPDGVNLADYEVLLSKIGLALDRGIVTAITNNRVAVRGRQIAITLYSWRQVINSKKQPGSVIAQPG